MAKSKALLDFDTNATVRQLVNNADTLHKNAGDKIEACVVYFADHRSNKHF